MDMNSLSRELRSSLPKAESHDILLELLDAIDAQIIIIDSDSRIRFINKGYYDTYGKHFQNAGIRPEQILNHKLSDLTGDARDFILKLLKSRETRPMEFFLEPDTKYSGLADIIPIETESFTGTAVFQQQSSQLEKLTKQLNHCRQLLSCLQKKEIIKDSLPPRFRQIVGESDVFLKILQTSAQVAKSNGSVCILGESGVGKEVLAEAIHYSSNYADGPFIRVNCASIPESLMESELFGYEKGAFTGANSRGSIGKLEAANNGTLFLDELGEMPKSMQAKLLRALQEREICRVGGHKTIKLNFRLITATNRNLEQMVKDGDFREDLYYRVVIIPIYLPPLRERKSDIPLLTDYFLSSLDQPQWKNRHFSEEVLYIFSNYNWPGNIRELKNCVERMAILCPTECIGIEYLPSNLEQKNLESNKILPDLSQYNLKQIVEKVEYETIRMVLSITEGNKAKAIEILGISKRNFYMKLEKFGLK